tara:strand:+ start:1910 stop:2386 length:477 start_codon:yes stop_codon:yes gene_type:complete
MKLNGLLRTLAPTITKTIASSNPVAGMAVKMLSDRLGLNEKDPAKIEKFLEKNPDRVAEVKEVDRAFEDKIREMEIDLEAFQIEADSAKDARQHFSKDRTSKAFALISLVGFLIYCFFVTLMGEEVSAATTNLVIGYLGGLVSSAASSFYGSSSNIRK